MHKRALGRTGIETSILGIGSSPFRMGPVHSCAELLEQAFDLGIRYYDTARSYVNGEDAVALLAPRYRSQFVVATKTGARGGVLCVRDLHASLRTLKRDHLDVWMTHMIRTEHEYELCTALGGFCDVAAAARSAGLIRASGASFHAPTPVILRAIEENAFDVVMFQMNLIGRETVFGSSIASYRDILLPAAKRNGVGVVIMKVLAGGELRHGAPRLEFTTDERSGRDTIGGAVRYVAMNPLVSTAVVGMSGTDELARNVLAVKGVDDTCGDLFSEWTLLAGQIGRGECTRCGECVGLCPEGIEIPKVLRLHDQKRLFGMDAVATYRYSLLDRDASMCSHCKKCQEACPEEFDIAALLSHAHQALGQRASVQGVAE